MSEKAWAGRAISLLFGCALSATPAHAQGTDTHKLYCFTSATPLAYFLDSPQTYLAQAEKNWRALKGKP